MARPNAGSSTIECLVALVIFSLGALGASGVMGFSLRLATEGDRAAAAARLLVDEVSRLHSGASGGLCAGVTPGSRLTNLGVQVSSVLSPAPGGLALLVTTTYPTVRGPHADTSAGFLACR